jgi:glycosyltransferase involved in cell wall biosynthesis
MTSRPEKVLLLLPSLAGGGSQRVFSILLRHLDRTTFEPHLALLQVQGPYLKDIPSDVTVHDLKASRARYAIPRIVKVVKQIRPRTVLSTLGHMNLALTIAKPFLPQGTRLMIRESADPNMFLADSTSYRRIWAALYRVFYRRADKIVCLSDAMVEDMAVTFKLPRQKLVRIYNPVDVQKVRELAERSVNPYSGPGPHLLAAGRLNREKGFDLLLAAMPAVRKRFPLANLTILGEGPLGGELAAQAQRLGVSEAVCFPGFLENPWPYFRHSSLFVLPSRYEGLPNVVLEALAVQVPVVVADCPGAIRELEAAHARLVVVPPESAEALAEAIISVCSAPPGRGPRVDSSFALSKFNVSQIVSEYSNLLLS